MRPINIMRARGSEVSADPDWDSVTSLLPFDGVNGSTVFTDYKSVAWTRYGNTVIQNSNSKFGGSSGYFDGDSDAVYTANTVGQIVGGIGVPYTIECWGKKLGDSSLGRAGALWSQCANAGNGDQGFGVSTAGEIVCWRGANANGGTAQTFFTSPIMLDSDWHHYAESYDGTTIRLFLDGHLVASQASSRGWNLTSEPLRVGQSLVPVYSTYRSDWNGYIDDFRITNGVARYTADFAVPIKAYPSKGYIDPYWGEVKSLLRFNFVTSNVNIVDEKSIVWTRAGNAQLTNAKRKFGGAALLLDGSGDYLTTPSTSGLTASADVTIEAWVYPTASKALMAFCTKRPATGNTEFGFWIDSGKLRAIGYNANLLMVEALGVTTVPLNTWSHIALSVVGNIWRLFLNGVLDASATATGAIGSNTELTYIGRDRLNTARDFSGYIDEFRFTVGVGRYTTNFPLPTYPFPSGL